MRCSFESFGRLSGFRNSSAILTNVFVDWPVPFLTAEGSIDCSVMPMGQQ